MKRILWTAAFLVTVGLGLPILHGQDEPESATPTPPTASTPPATQPSVDVVPADELLSQMLKPASAAAKPLKPLPNPPAEDATSGDGAVAPDAPQIRVMREGTLLMDRTGRLSRAADGLNKEFVFDADSRTMADPPMIILPNRQLTAMESSNNDLGRDLHFRVTGVVTEYHGRNYLLLEKVVVVADVVQQF